MNLFLGDCLEKLKELETESIDSVVTDPPYGLAFMGKKWDYDVPSVEIWKEVLRVLKPGGHLLSFGGTRTYHRMVLNIEDAGFEIRDQIMWIYGSGFPKSMDISKAIDKQAGATRTEVLSKEKRPVLPKGRGHGRNDDGSVINIGILGASESYEIEITAPATDSAKQWQGWGTALKPALEPICLARKPISEKTVASNVLKYGTGAMNIDESRIAASENDDVMRVRTCKPETDSSFNGCAVIQSAPSQLGRWPANVIFDEEAGKILDEQSGVLKTGGIAHKANRVKGNTFDSGTLNIENQNQYANQAGGASRFFYCAKTSKSERNAGLEGMEKVKAGVGDERPSGQSMSRLDGRPDREMQNFHPTVKPIKLMTYLIKLITPPGGIILDPFMGSGSTGVAAKRVGFKFVGIERDESYFEIASKRTQFQKCS